MLLLFPLNRYHVCSVWSGKQRLDWKIDDTLNKGFEVNTGKAMAFVTSYRSINRVIGKSTLCLVRSLGMSEKCAIFQ